MGANEEIKIASGKSTKGRILERIEVEAAQNGYIVRCSYKMPEPEKTPKNGSCCVYPSTWQPPVNKVFESWDGVMEFLGKAKIGANYDEDD